LAAVAFQGQLRFYVAPEPTWDEKFLFIFASGGYF
jgi:hypothetical protein